ncbi:hypothetical protein SAMN04487914_11816 [Arthrobacter sp. ok909]|nr:hypothetical protein SAMN04487914_11816 [Arthrobacter sp. ok909]
MGSMVFTITAALAQREHEIKRERITDSVRKRREAGKDLGGRQKLLVVLHDGGRPATLPDARRRAGACGRLSGQVAVILPWG